MTEYTCDSFRFFNLFPVYFGGKGTDRQNRNARRERELEAEVRALRKKLAEKDEVIELLKKSIGIISKP